MMFDWLSFWCGFGAFPALMVLAFFAITFLLLFILVFRGYFDNREEESEDEAVDSASTPYSSSEGADVHVPSDLSVSEDDFKFAINTFNSSLDGYLSNFTECLDENYKLLDKLKPGKHDKKIAKVEQNILYTRYAISLLSFIQTHGEEAFLKYLQSTGFFDQDKLRARSACDPYAPMPEDYPPLEEDKP